MAFYPTAQQFSARYVLVSPRGYRAVFNDPNDADFIGYIGGEDGLTGLDSPEVRAAMYDLVEQHGALAPYFYHGFRPVTMKVEIYAATIAERNMREGKLHRALNDMMRSEGTLTWTPEGGISQYVSVRKYQPLRISGTWLKTASIFLAAPDPYIYSTDLRSASAAAGTSFTVENQGGAEVSPISGAFTGPATGVYVQNLTSGTVNLRLAGYTLPSGQTVTWDFTNRTVKNGSTNLYQYNDFPNNWTWPTLLPGINTFRGNADSGATGATTLTMTWRDAWL